MHDCRKTKRNLVELVFGELTAAQQQLWLAEVRSCPACSQEHLVLLATLRAVDQATDAAMPEEGYWAGYERRLRAKLAEPARPGGRERLATWLASWLDQWMAKPGIPVAIIAGLLLLAAISAFWLTRQSRRTAQELVVATTPTPQLSPTISVPVPTGLSHSVSQKEYQSALALKASQTRRAPSLAHSLVRPLVRPKDQFASSDLMVANNPSVGSNRSQQMDILPLVAPASHFEQAQLLLRSFRNARAEGKSVARELAYERQQAGKLVYSNILLRREAEAKGHLPVEDALNTLEPLLLDIANLPDKPSRNEMQVIRQRMQKQGIIATLQLVSSETERFSPPARLNP